ncbi:MAG TPA: TldD/PmbA family protein [Archaeoglobus profundus]|nr:TldD/PmbA family protein [Archaeoglobus profundus]
MNFYDIRYVENKSLTISIENGRIEKIKFKNSSGKAFRVLKNGFWGFFSGNVDEDEGLRMAEKNAICKGDVKVCEVKVKEGKYILKPKVDARDIAIEEKIELLRDIEKELKDKHIVSTKVVYTETFKKFHYKDSSGVEVYYEVPRIGVIIQAVAKDKTLQFYSERLLKPAGYEVFNDNVFEMAKKVKEVLKELVKAKSPPSGKMNIVMDSTLGGVFIHEAFGHAVEADHVLQGASVVSDKLGKKIADESVNVYDDPTLKEFGFFPFDDEGVKAERKTIIENGILKSFLHSRETAMKLGGKPGNSRAQGLNFPIVRMSNTFIDKGDYSFDELLEEAKSGVYLIGSRGGETNPATGYFQFNAQYGYIIKNGELAEMIRDVSLSGNTLEILKDIKLGKDLSFDPGFCGKNGQLVPVSDGSPPSLIKALVGGA